MLCVVVPNNAVLVSEVW